jgi:hypothetical protein
VFGIIKRFSEDIDLVINRHELGFSDENDPAKQQGTNLRNRTIEKLKATCCEVIEKEFTPKLTTQMSSIIGNEGWTLGLATEAKEHDIVDFQYPKGISDAITEGYIKRIVRLELGCRGEQIPCEEATVTPYAAEVFPNEFSIPNAPVSVISAERTFWEKVTILHREYYRGTDGKPVTERVFRHYHDVVVISQHPRGESALTKNVQLLDAVREHKEHFFREAGARYDLAKKGTLRLAPPKGIRDALRNDYDGMREMYFGSEPDFDEVMTAIEKLEQSINGN